MERPDPSTIPVTPGVYIYKDTKGRIIYVGKARILRRRVLSYFRSNGLPAKTVAMINRAQSIEYIPTTTEKEALLLEASLIKKHRPHYNIVLRDDKQYVLFKINLKNDFPRLEITRKVKRDGAKYFGPFTSALSARETWKLLHRAFHIRTCKDRAMKNRVRPCLYYHLGQCPAPCMGKISSEEYKQSAKKVCELLSGNADELLNSLNKDMLNAADDENFEKAAILRDQIKAVEKTIEKQAAVLPGAEDMDAIGLFQGDCGIALGIIFVRNGAVGESRTFYWSGLTYEDTPELLMSFLNQFYEQAPPPPRILLPWLPAIPKEQECIASKNDSANPENDIDDFFETRLTLEQIFTERRGGAVRIVAPQNDRDNQLIDLAKAAGKEEIRKKQNQNINNILEKIGAILGLNTTPERIECVDVSHISGTKTRVGMVVYENGKPVREDWRIYAMPDSADDCATLHDWIERRLESGPPWPDLLLIDGGRGQLAAVARALKKAGEEDLFGLAAIAKARDETGRPDRRAGNISDRIFISGRLNPVALKDGSPELLFLQQIRDSTHQFAVNGHRRARKAAAFSGELMRLPGIGPATARLLWDKFGSIELMAKATEEDLTAIPGIAKAKAKKLLPKLQSLL